MEARIEIFPDVHKGFLGEETQVMNKGDGGWSTFTFSEWVENLIKSKDWDSWILYNDAPPAKKKAARGHAKGIVVWSKDSIGWLVHSVPGWPKSLDDLSLPEAGESSVKDMGQSFVWIKIPRLQVKLYTGTIKNVQRPEWEKGNYGIEFDGEKTALEAILEHVSLLIGRSDYAYENNFFLPEEEELFKKNDLAASEDLHVISLSSVSNPLLTKVYHIAKGMNWKPCPGIPIDTVIVKATKECVQTVELPDFYRHGLLHGFGAMITNTCIPMTNAERRKNQKMIADDASDRDIAYYCDSDITKVDSILFHERSSEAYNICPSENDNGKWAISADREAFKWSFVGDLDRKLSQGNLGGGGVLIVDEVLRDNIRAMVCTMQPQHPYHYDF